MYLEFRLPSGAGGAAAGFALQMLRQKLQKWSKQHNISYTSKVHKYTYRISFDDDAHYTFFMSSWNNEDNIWYKPKIIDPMKIDRFR